jgi:hypothetical protein
MPSSYQTVVFRGTVPELYAVLNSLPAVARHAAPALRLRAATALLGRIKTAFVVKARGGTDAAGDRWKPLSPYTIARRRRGRGKDFQASDVEILRDTGELLTSLTPKVVVGDTPPVVPKQVFRLEHASVIIGTNREWALDQHEGRPHRVPPLPQRRLWPAPNRWPSSWWKELAEQGRDGLLAVLLFLLARH